MIDSLSAAFTIADRFSVHPASRIRLDDPDNHLRPCDARRNFRPALAALGFDLTKLYLLRTETSADDAWAIGDEERIAQIGRALAGNALTHTPDRTRVVLRARAGDEHVWLEVEDDGPGIPVDQLERVFDRFYRVEEGIAPGTGLGLAIARELATLMGGRVRAASRPGRTVFTLELARTPSLDRLERVAVSH